MMVLRKNNLPVEIETGAETLRPIGAGINPQSNSTGGTSAGNRALDERRLAAHSRNKNENSQNR